MSSPSPIIWSGRADWGRMTLIGVTGAFGAAAVGTLLAPLWFWVPLVPVAIIGVAVVAFRHTVAFCVAWLLIAGATLEMTLADIVGPSAFETTIGTVKAAELGLGLICVLRYGGVLDVFNPSLAFLAMFVAGIAHGLHPGLTAAESLRSLLGSVAPFVFAFSRLPPRWSQAIIRATATVPAMSVIGGAVLEVAGLRPLFYEGGGERLAGLGHPAFLASLCLAAIYACLVELYRDGRSRWLLLLALNFLILVLTGARAPLAYGVAVTTLTLVFIRSAAIPSGGRILPLLLAGCLLPLALLLAHNLPEVRLFNVLSTEAANLSGRDLLWPPFQQEAAQSPWFGWGVGAGNAIIAPDSALALTIQSRTAHNEYLRMLVEGGQLGRALLIALFVAWVVWHTRRLCRTDRAIMRLVFVAFAAHALTDNILISTPASVFFAFVTAVFARPLDEYGTGGVGTR